MNKLFSILAGIGTGAGLMYFYDPSRGRRRRALVRDQVNSVVNRADDSLDVAVRDLRNRTRGILAEAMATLSDEGAPDWIVEERVRAELGRNVRFPGSIEVSASGGHITLHGPILTDEADRLVSRVAAVRGVRGVNNQLDVHQEPGNVPGLQGDPNLTRLRSELEQENWSPSLRLLSSVGGALLAVYGGMRRGVVGTALGTAGLGLVARGVTNTDFKRLFGIGSARDAISIQKAININTSVDRLYQFWSNPENLPRFMHHLRQVKSLGNGRSHWVAVGPAGKDVEWDAVITREIPNEMIAWESVAGSEVKTSGMVRFRSNPGGGTRVTVHMNYTPPAGALGHAVATLLGADPKRAMDEDLARLKTLFEEGKTTVRGQEFTRPDLAGASS